MEAKANLRLAIKERLAKLSAKDRDVESRVIVKQLKKLIGERPGLVTGFIPLSDEPNILPLLEEYLAVQIPVALPGIENGALAFRTVTDLKQIKRNPVTNLTEPLLCCPPVDTEQIVWVIVPGRAFTSDGKRLGRGNGGYDRWIRKQRMHNASTKFVGICFECQLISSMPTEHWDEPVDIVVTAKCIYK